MKKTNDIPMKYEEEGGGRSRTVRQIMSSRRATPEVLDFVAATQGAKELRDKNRR